MFLLQKDLKGITRITLVIVALLLLLVTAACEEEELDAEDKNGDLKEEAEVVENGDLSLEAEPVELGRRENPHFLTEETVIYAGIRDEHMGTDEEQQMWEIFAADPEEGQAEVLYSEIFVGDLPLMEVSGDYFFFPSAPDELTVWDQDLNTVDVLAANWARHHPDSDRIYFQPVAEMGDEVSLAQYELETNTTEEIYTGGDYMELAMIDNHRGMLYVEDEDDFTLMEMQVGDEIETREITSFDQHLLAFEAGYSAPREEALAFGAWETETGVQLFVYDTEGNQLETVTLEGFEPELVLSPEGEYLLVITSDKGGAMAKLLHLEDMTEMEVPDMNNASWSPDGERLIYETPLREVELFNVHTETVEEVEYPLAP